MLPPMTMSPPYPAREPGSESKARRVSATSPAARIGSASAPSGSDSLWRTARIRFTTGRPPGPRFSSEDLRETGQEGYSRTELAFVDIAIGDEENETVQRDLAGDVQPDARRHVDKRAPGRGDALGQVTVTVLMKELGLQRGGKGLAEGAGRSGDQDSLIAEPVVQAVGGRRLVGTGEGPPEVHELGGERVLKGRHEVHRARARLEGGVLYSTAEFAADPVGPRGELDRETPHHTLRAQGGAKAKEDIPDAGRSVLLLETPVGDIVRVPGGTARASHKIE